MKNGQPPGSKFKKVAPKNLIGENVGERKEKNPKANSVKYSNDFKFMTFRYPVFF